MQNKYFPKVVKQIPFEGKNSKNQLSFKYYNRDQKVGYILAACMVDTRFDLGWLSEEEGLKQIAVAFDRLPAL